MKDKLIYGLEKVKNIFFNKFVFFSYWIVSNILIIIIFALILNVSFYKQNWIISILLFCNQIIMILVYLMYGDEIMGKKKKVKKEEIIDLNADNQNLKKILPKGKQEIKSTFNEDMKFNDDLLNDGMKEFDFDQDEEEIKDDKKEKLTSEIRELKKLLDQKRKEMLEYIGVE